MTSEWIDKLGFRELPEEPEKSTQDANFNVNEVQELCRISLDFLAAIALPLVFKYFFPDTFKKIWEWLLHHVHKTRDFSQLVIGLPRGFGKTMLIKIFILYCVLFTKRQFILIIAGTQTKANNIISDVISMLNEANIIRVFGNWKLSLENDRQDLKRFGFRGRNIILMGAGADSDIRGITLENTRPDVMIFDDIQTRDDANSEVISTHLEEWMIGTAMKAKNPEGCLFIFIANMYPTKWSLLRRLKANPTWTKFIVGGILANGESLWEDLQPIRQLIKEYQNDASMGKPEIFYSEVLNDENASVNHLLDLSKLPLYSFSNDEIHAGHFIIIDPSNDKANSDAVTIIYFRIYNAIPVAYKIIEGRLSPGDTIREALKLALTMNCRLIAIESNAYQYTLNYWFNFICTQLGIVGIEPVEIYSGVLSKITRILNMFKELLAGELYIHPSCRPQADLQITQFNPLKNNNTDGILDCLAYAKKVIAEYSHLINADNILEMQEFSKIQVLSVEANACF